MAPIAGNSYTDVYFNSFIFNIFSDSKFSQQNVPNSNDMAD